MNAACMGKKMTSFFNHRERRIHGAISGQKTIAILRPFHALHVFRGQKRTNQSDTALFRVLCVLDRYVRLFETFRGYLRWIGPWRGRAVDRPVKSSNKEPKPLNYWDVRNEIPA